MPPCQMLVIHPAFNLIIDILPRDSKGRLRSCKLLREATPCELSVIAVRWVNKLFPHLLDLSIPNGCILLPSSSHRDFYPHIMKSSIVEVMLGCNYPLATERPSYAGTSIQCSALTKQGLDIFMNNIQECKMWSWMIYCTFQCFMKFFRSPNLISSSRILWGRFAFAIQIHLQRVSSYVHFIKHQLLKCRMPSSFWRCCTTLCYVLEILQGWKWQDLTVDCHFIRCCHKD